MVSDASKLLAIVCMLIASRNNGCVPADSDYIRRVANLDKKPCFKQLLSCGFLELQADAIAKVQADAIIETEAETETELEAETETDKKKKRRHTKITDEEFLNQLRNNEAYS